MIKAKNLVDTLKEHAFLVGFRLEHIDRLAAIANEVHFERDQIIFRENDESSFLYLIISGKVALEVTALGKTLRVQTLTEGEELGWSSVLPAGGKRFQARAVSSVRALAFDGARLREECDKDCSFGYALMRRMLSVVAGRLQAFRVQLLDVYSPEGPKSA
jgi:CRP-like cAMP-binding protein